MHVQGGGEEGGGCADLVYESPPPCKDLVYKWAHEPPASLPHCSPVDEQEWSYSKPLRTRSGHGQREAAHHRSTGHLRSRLVPGGGVFQGDQCGWWTKSK